VVRTNDKQEVCAQSRREAHRARQGHSLSVKLGLEPLEPPEVLYHGTVERFVPSILANGLERRARQHVHLSIDIATAARVGGRRGRPVILKIAAAEMHAAGFQFLLFGERGLADGTRPPAMHLARGLCQASVDP
jgi:putative RNA 2'-phosphotransferase